MTGQDEHRTNYAVRIILLLVLIILTVFLIINRDQIQEFSRFGYLGIFLVSILANATIIFPLPGVMFTSAMGMVYDPLLVAVAAGSGAALGELTGYLAGFSGQFVVSRKDWYERVVDWMSRYGNLTVLLLAFVPNPLFDLAGITAGVLKMPILRFLFWCTLGKILKMILFAFGGLTLFRFLQP
jgi:membrane protein YqaA with SNARE-associated domain